MSSKLTAVCFTNTYLRFEIIILVTALFSSFVAKNIKFVYFTKIYDPVNLRPVAKKLGKMTTTPIDLYIYIDNTSASQLYWFNQSAKYFIKVVKVPLNPD